MNEKISGKFKINLALEINFTEEELNKLEFDKEVENNFKETKAHLRNQLLKYCDKVKINNFRLIKE